jgi:hypothetical protein
VTVKGKGAMETWYLLGRRDPAAGSPEAATISATGN